MFFFSRTTDEFLNRPLRYIIILGSIFLFIFCVWSAVEARKQTSDRIVDWLPNDTEELTVFYERFYRHFVEGEYLMVSWKGCDITDKRLDVIADKLTAPPAEGVPPHFGNAMTTPSVIESLKDYAQLSEEQAKNRLSGWLIGQDRMTACLILVPPLNIGLPNPGETLKYLLKTIKEETGLDESDIFIAGTSIDSVAISEIAAESQQTLLPFFLLFSLALLLGCLRHYFAALIVFWVAMINEELAGTLLYWSGAHVDSISMLTSSLVYVLTISGSVHLMNYYRKTLAEMKQGEEKNAPMQTFYKAIRPCSLAAFTTIMGMGSLAVSKMVPIQTFGVFASCTLFLGTIWFFLFILSVFQERPIRQWFPDARRTQFSTKPPPNTWRRLGYIIHQGRYPITALTFLAIAVFAWGIKDLHTSVSFHGLLPKDAKVLQDYRMLEEQIGGLIPIEVVVQFPDDEKADKPMLRQLHFLAQIVWELKKIEDVDAVVSILNFLPHLPPLTGGGRAVIERAAIEGWLERNHDSMKELLFFNKVDNHTEDAGIYWRISLRVSTQKNKDYSAMIADVRERLKIIWQENKEIDLEKVRFDVTGGVPLVLHAQELLLWDLISSFIMAFGLIAFTMMVVLRGIVRGLLAMVPNVFPCVIVFGMLGLCGIPVDMGSMMTASVALGISVDGTLHLLTWVNVALRQGLSRQDAVCYALQRCGTALLQTMVICGIGMLVFAWSDFVPVARFSLMLCAILMVSLFGAVVAFPAILCSPLGRIFESRDQDKEKKWML